MGQPLRILVIEDNPADFKLIERHLANYDVAASCRRVDRLDELQDALTGNEWDLILSDYSVPKLDFHESFILITQVKPDLPIILVSGSVGEEQAVELLKLGVRDFVLKENLTRLVPAIERAVREAREHRIRVAAEEELHQSELRFRGIFNHAPIAIGIEEITSGTLLEVNSAWLQLFGMTRDEAIGRSTIDVGVYPLAEEREAIINDIRAHGRIVSRAMLLRKWDGSLLDIFYSAEVMKLGAVTFLQVMMIDMTEQFRIKRALQTTEETLRKLHTAVEQSPVTIVITDRSGTIEYVNPSFTRVTGYTAEEALGQNPRILKGDTPQRTYHTLWEAISRGESWEGEFHNRKKSGELFWERATIAPIKNDFGITSHFLAVKEDITVRRELEEQLRHAQKMEAVGQLAGGVAHDFNNIMQVIIGNAQLQAMANEKLGLETRYEDEIFRAVERGVSLTRSLLVFSRKQPLEIATFDLNNLVQESCRLAPRLVTESITFNQAIAAEPLLINGDTGLVQQIVFNLVTNARDAIAGQGQITISTGRSSIDAQMIATNGLAVPTADYATLMVRDSGCGIPAEIRDRIFEPFFTTKEPGKGTGLGLAMIYGTVHEMNGFILVESAPETGTTFSLYFPLLAENAVVTPTEQRSLSTRGSGETLLLVEDDPAVRNALDNILTVGGYRVLAAKDAEEALNMARESQGVIQLAILDVILSGMNGSEAAVELQRVQPGLPVLFLSGYGDDFLRSKGIEGDLLRKPVHPGQLLDQIDQLLQKATRQITPSAISGEQPLGIH